VLVSARLYAFEGDTRTWKERGRGEVRLNDSAKDEGVFQSRLGEFVYFTSITVCNTYIHVKYYIMCVQDFLVCTDMLYFAAPVMRASGTYRVLLNTHLWAQMSCDRANQKSIRITAQHVSSTEEIGVYLITVSTSTV